MNKRYINRKSLKLYIIYTLNWYNAFFRKKESICFLSFATSTYDTHERGKKGMEINIIFQHARLRIKAITRPLEGPPKLKGKKEQFRLKGPYQLPSTLESNLPSDRCLLTGSRLTLTFHSMIKNPAQPFSFPFLFFFQTFFCWDYFYQTEKLILFLTRNF